MGPSEVSESVNLRLVNKRSNVLDNLGAVAYTGGGAV